MPGWKSDPNTDHAQHEINRRKFFIELGAGSLAIAGAGAAAFAAQYLSPNVLYEASPVVNVGRPDRYPEDSVTLDASMCAYETR